MKERESTEQTMELLGRGDFKHQPAELLHYRRTAAMCRRMQDIVCVVQLEPLMLYLYEEFTGNLQIYRNIRDVV